MKKKTAKKASINEAEVIEASEVGEDTTTKPSATNSGIKEAGDVEGYDPMTPEAFKWATSKKSIPGAYEPILYFGPAVAIEISEILGRPLGLEEVKLLAWADGEEQKCTITGEKFQPVGYVPFVPRDLENDLNDCGYLSKIPLPSGGQFYLIKGQVTAVSGSVYHYDARSGDYNYAHASPLVAFASDIQRMTGKKIWGMTLDRTKSLLEKKDERRKAKNEMFEKSRRLAEQFVSSSPQKGRYATNRLGDAFPKAKSRPARHQNVDGD
jgi:hypothetical protein